MKLKKCQYKGIFFSCFFKINFIASQFCLVKICFDNCMIRFHSKLNYLDMYLSTHIFVSLKVILKHLKEIKTFDFFLVNKIFQQNSSFCLENFNFLSPPSPCYWQAYFSRKYWEPYYTQNYCYTYNEIYIFCQRPN